MKFDRQIIAIARVDGATTIYTNDGQLARQANAAGINAISPDELPEPPQPPQLEMPLDPVEPEAPDSDDTD